MSNTRRLDLEGCFNFRDLGGYPAAGGRTVRWRRLFRSDALHHATAADCAYLSETLGVRTLIDLRNPNEAASSGVSVIAGRGLAWHALPVLQTLMERAPKREEPVGEIVARRVDRSPRATAVQYEAILRFAGSRFVEAVERLTDEDALPAVFFCAAGKDRTGLLAALVLGLLGVHDEDVVADYALTADFIDEVIRRIQADPVYESTKDDPVEAFRPAAETMQHIVSWVRREYGSWTGYALANGLAEDSAQRLRDLLLIGAVR